MKRDSSVGELPPPPSCLLPLGHSEWRQARAAEEAACDRLFARAKPAPNLLDRDDADPRLDARSAESRHPAGGRSAPQRVDDDRGIEKDSCHSADPSGIVAALLPDPGRRIGVPRVAAVVDLAEGRFDVVPTALVLEPSADEFGDEGAASSSTASSVEFGDELVVECYVQTHVLTIAHALFASVERVPGHLPAVPRPRVSRPSCDLTKFAVLTTSHVANTANFGWGAGGSARPH